jgi:type II secretory pathway component GspD/PulD (secretin)
MVKPFVGEDGAVSGTGYKLIVRASAANLEQVENLITELDQQLQQLRITVAMADSREALQEGYGGHLQARVGDQGQVAIGETEKNLTPKGGSASIDNGKVKGDVHVYHTQRKRSSPAAQTTRVTEGYWATIHSGYAVPYVEWQRNADGTATRFVRHRSVTTGFEVLPRVNGENVVLQIRPQRNQLSPKGGGRIDIQQIDTTVRGRLGEWIALGGVDESGQSEQHGLGSSRHTRSRDQQKIWVKVERIE